MACTNLAYPVERALLKAHLTQLFKRFPPSIRQQILGEVMSPDLSCNERHETVRGLCKAGRRQYVTSAYLVLDVTIIADLGLAFQRHLLWLQPAIVHAQADLRSWTHNPAQHAVESTAMDDDCIMLTEEELTYMAILEQKERNFAHMQVEHDLIVGWTMLHMAHE